MMAEKLDTRRITVFLAFAFGVAWTAGLVIYLTGGLVDSLVLVDTGDFQVTLAFVLLATVYMWAPALAHILTRAVTREGWRDTYLRPRLKRGWPYWLAAWFAPALLAVVGGAVYFAIFPHYFDPSLATIHDSMVQSAERPYDLPLFVTIRMAQTILVAPLINVFFTFGEEFGWRAYLQPRLMPLGGRKAMLLMGAIWGVWHWPVIAMGHNYGLYGLDYPGAPWTGMLAMVWFTFVVGTFIGWATLRGGSVWPAAIGHAALNATAGLPILVTQGEPPLVLGPTAAGVIGSAAWTAVALWLLLRPGALAVPESPEQGE
jgi:membrane protease YdiL (CAAX protease family)